VSGYDFCKLEAVQDLFILFPVEFADINRRCCTLFSKLHVFKTKSFEIVQEWYITSSLSTFHIPPFTHSNSNSACLVPVFFPLELLLASKLSVSDYLFQCASRAITTYLRKSSQSTYFLLSLSLYILAIVFSLNTEVDSKPHSHEENDRLPSSSLNKAWQMVVQERGRHVLWERVSCWRAVCKICILEPVGRWSLFLGASERASGGNCLHFFSRREFCGQRDSENCPEPLFSFLQPQIYENICKTTIFCSWSHTFVDILIGVIRHGGGQKYLSLQLHDKCFVLHFRVSPRFSSPSPHRVPYSAFLSSSSLPLTQSVFSPKSLVSSLTQQSIPCIFRYDGVPSCAYHTVTSVYPKKWELERNTL